MLNDIKKNSIAKFERTIPTEIAIRDIRKYLIERKTLIKSLLNADIGEDSFKTSLRNLYKEIFLKYYQDTLCMLIHLGLSTQLPKRKCILRVQCQRTCRRQLINGEII